ncbi:MAG: class I SAM-dependent methyltransferase [Proteobacteria bacterium]|nr:class I SAM-dependent methyltransferase [Pseudomonadota bacterium]
MVGLRGDGTFWALDVSTPPRGLVFACPRCLTGLPDVAESPLVCPCGAEWPVVDGIPDYYVADPTSGEDPDLTRTVRSFYEEHPFPHYLPDDDRGSLLRNGRSKPFTRSLDEELPPNARVVELGCGTGQMSLFLGIAGRRVTGLDLSGASLRVADEMRRRCGLDSVRFARGNLFHPPFRPGSVDVVVSNGVLHHTADARQAYSVAASLLRPGGYLVVGLYNRWGRLLLPMLRKKHKALAGDRGDAWYHDQHEHPHETRHTVDEVLGWVRENGLEYVNAQPPVTFEDGPAALFTQRPEGSWFEHQLVQLSWLGRAEDGGLWVTVARRAPPR